MYFKVMIIRNNPNNRVRTRLVEESSQNAILEHRTIFNGYQFQWLWISRCTVHLGSRLRHSRSALPCVTYYMLLPVFLHTGRCMARCQGQVYLASGVACVGSGGGAVPSKTALWRKKASFGTHFVIMSAGLSLEAMAKRMMSVRRSRGTEDTSLCFPCR